MVFPVQVKRWRLATHPGPGPVIKNNGSIPTRYVNFSHINHFCSNTNLYHVFARMLLADKNSFKDY